MVARTVTQSFTGKPYTVVGGPGKYNYQGAPTTVNSSAAVTSAVQNGVAITLTSPGSGTKSDHQAPSLFDYGADAAFGATSSQWTAGGKTPVAAGGIYNIQNQPPGFSPSGAQIIPISPFVRAVIAGCHLNSTNDCSSVMLGWDFTGTNNGTTITYPFCCTIEYDWCFDPNLFNDPQTDNNTKTLIYGDGASVYAGNQYGYWEPFPISQFPISAISQTNPMVVTCPMNQAGAPAGVNDIMSFFGIEGMTQLNGLSGQVTAVSGGFGNWQFTVAIDATGFSAYQPTTINISAATKSNPCTITLSTVSGTHPLAGTGKDWIWITGVVGMTQLNQQTELAVTNLRGSSGAWLADLVNGQFSGVNVDSSGYGTYVSGGTITTGGLSVPFSTLGANTAANTYIANRNFRMNPINQLQNPDAAGHGMTALTPSPMPCATAGVKIRRRIEMCLTTSQTLTPGYFRIFDNNVKVFDFVGQTDNTAALTFLRNFGVPSGYHRDRGINNFAYMENAYADWSPASGQVYKVYAGDASTYAACTILEPQPFLGTVTNTSVPLTKFWQGRFANSATTYFYAMPEGSTVGTAVQLTDIHGNAAFTITPTSIPSITTASLPGATHGSAYNSGALTVTGNTGAMTWTLASVARGGGANAAPSPNTYAVNASTGAVTGTPTTAGTDIIVISGVDSNSLGPVSCYKMFNLAVA